ncbi:chemotaxis protein CheW [Dactylosporangium sucinum]|uniref:Chemotaxis protein CheW n=1 Tax=Dactylosporangium sucinum TaxID=1424081 RepID=A0A917U956_9ACTN|nr:chemotaxis protein CheW [Dactylosporangium sucinum]GGM67678.1 chemotaxis protein CheW [Dactylosporangium sucinum]
MSLHGVFTVADVHVALPLSELREVLPCPRTFEPLLARAPGLVGAVNVRHQVIPVLDLRRTLDLADSAEPEVVVVVNHEGSVFGLLAGSVRGVVPIEEDARLGMTVNSELPPLFSRTFERPDDGSVVCLLDCAAVRRLPGMVLADDTGGPSGAMAVAQERTTGDTTMMMLLRCGEIGVCVQVEHIHSVVPELILKSSPIDGDVVHGVIELGDHYVPTVDTLAVLGLGTLGPIDVKRGVAFAYERGLLAFAVTEAVAIVGVPDADVLPMPAFGLPATAFASGILPGQAGGTYLVVDGARLRADEQLGTLAALGTPVGGTPPARRPQASDAGRVPADGRVIEPVVRKYLTYLAGVEVATPLTQVHEIVPFPEHVIPFVGGGPVRGVFTHHRRSVPLICLATLLGQRDEAEPATARVVLVAGVGFIVPALRAIEESVWEERLPAADASPPGLAGAPLVKIDGRILPHIDLERLARTMVGHREDAAADPPGDRRT